MKADFTSTMSPPPHLLILHQHEDEITGKLSDSAFIMTDAEDVGETLRGAGYLEIASVPTGMKLLRKVWHVVRTKFLAIVRFID